jgi:hypothetical protein
MLEQHIIQTKGFRNVDGGFQVAVRCPYYRGIWASLLEGASVTVDGERFTGTSIRWTLRGETLDEAALADSSELRWPYEEPAVLTVAKPDRLEPGLHEVEVGITWRWSYIPVEMQPTTHISARTLVLSR